MIYAITELWSTGFWVWTALFMSIFVMSVSGAGGDHESIRWTTAGVVLYFLLTVSFVRPLEDPIDPWFAAKAVGTYFAIGLAWGTARWVHLLRSVRQYRADSDHLTRDQFMNGLRTNFQMSYFPPRASDDNNQSRLYNWTIYWPVNIAVNLFSGPLTWIWNNFVLVFSGLSNIMFKGVEAPDAPKAKKVPATSRAPISE